MTALPADGLGLPFLEGVALHPVRNVAKMSAGHALDDMDRKPWLHTLADRIRESAESGRGLVVACSTLKRRYRDELRSAATEVGCLYLAVNRDIVRGRVAGRAGHFMPAGLVDAQFDEPGAAGAGRARRHHRRHGGPPGHPLAGP
ncbi:gluconokinase, GntK/IdnK-type [Streptomyces sp. NBC_01352]|uniref:gluconokinase n=1 Tax=Streptomyces sp. NBC_01352 TaxID=2903834 RepID=UPI002E344807|nr:gluconokinase, GntK/IdnK-type [Streptomyces sp. NBC_01352]